MPAKKTKKNESDVLSNQNILFPFYHLKTFTPSYTLYNYLVYFQVLFNMVVEVPRWSNAKMEVKML